MARLKTVMWVLVLAAAAAIIGWVGFHGSTSYLPAVEGKANAQLRRSDRSARRPSAQEESRRSNPDAPGEANAPAEPSPPGGDPNRSGDEDDAAEPNAPPDSSPGTESESSSAVPEDPNDPFEAINLKDVEMKNIIEKIAKWTGKTVIPGDEAMKQKITIYAPEKLPRSKALKKIYSALRMKGYVAEEEDDTIFLKPLAEARLGVVPTVRADEPLAAFENRDQVVQKFFALKHYPPAQMGEIIQPLVGEYGHVGADETTSTLLVIDTVSNLMRIEHIIAQFDVPGAGKTITEIFEIQYGDPAEIVQLLRMLLGESPDSRRRGSSYRGRPSEASRPSRPPSSRPGGKDATGAATSVVIGAGDIPIVLIPEPKRKWIIASGSADDIKSIRDWIAKLDVAEPVRSEYETVAIAYADPREVASRIEDALQDMPGTEVRPGVLVRPLEQSRQIMIFGRPDLRQMVKQLIAEIDMPAGTFETKVFDLKHADPEQIKQNIDNLYGEDTASRSRYSYYYYRSSSQRSPSDTVKAIAFPTMSQVTVIASPENMRKIEKQIEEWDVALDVEAVKPRILTLQNSDPVQMADLLTRLFTEEGDDSSRSFMRMLFWDDFGDQKKKIVGPLYGQLTFEEVPGTKKIIVISKIPQAYDVVEQLVYDLDREEMAEIPHVVQLKYADPEDLSERLNAMFNEPGTVAPIRRTQRGLSEYSMEDSSAAQNRGNARSDSGGGGGGSAAGEYTPWWSRGARRTLDEEPISNVIGRVRFVPDPRSKSILVLSPPEFQANIKQMIETLDVPGRQVMIKAVVMTVDHEDLTSLGVQLASNPAAFGNLDENAVMILNDLMATVERGSFDFQAGANINVLVDFLAKTINAQVLNEQTVWTKDNEEASFFRGDKVAFQTDFSLSDTGGRATSSFEFERVGMTLRARPSITPEKNVDMIINVQLSQLTNDLVNQQPVRTEMESTTNMIVADGETLMLGGMLFQANSSILRKVPLLGDIPLVGGLFRHSEKALANKELIVFITPFVVDDGETLSDEARRQIEATQQKLGDMRNRMDETAEVLAEKVQEE